MPNDDDDNNNNNKRSSQARSDAIFTAIEYFSYSDTSASTS